MEFGIRMLAAYCLAKLEGLPAVYLVRVFLFGGRREMRKVCVLTKNTCPKEVLLCILVH